MKRVTGIVVLVVFSAFFLGLAGTSAQAAQKTVTLKYANFFPPMHTISKLSAEWGKEVEKRTNGQVKVTLFPGGSLTSPTETYDSVLKGIADVGLSFCGYSRGRFPLTEVIDLPLGYKSSLAGCMLANAYYQKFKPKEFDDVKVMYFITSPPHRLFTKKPVSNLEELKGMKIRSTGTSAKVVLALGGSAVAMPMSEAYSALSKSVVEGIIMPFEPLIGFKLIDVVSSATLFKAAYVNVAYVVMNKEKWNAISPENQAAIEKINKEWYEKTGKLWDVDEEAAKKLFAEKGKEIIELSDDQNALWTERLQPILSEYVKNKEKMDLPAGEALKFCQEFLKDFQK